MREAADHPTDPKNPMDPMAPTNRLIHETSPYLLQHARNPVDWYPWGEEALRRARELDRPIFLSVGYSACHWCHVMERESFEDPATAALMNELFINIKVDREERPDLDQIYMAAVQALTMRGGWPMSVWLTPELQPFHGGTYYPPTPRYGMSSFSDVLRAVNKAWTERRADVAERAGDLTNAIRQMGAIERDNGLITGELIDAAAASIHRSVDEVHGGIGRAPKFPHAVEMRLLLRDAARTNRRGPRDAALFSLEKMIRGGIYDQLGGGFHRYATDDRWLIPHFEKMLYDNALIPLACLEAYQITRAPIYRRAVVETMDWVLREMTADDGGFYSTLDADSEGVEGKFYVWSKGEVDALLGADARAFAAVYDVTAHGNWEETNILHLPRPVDGCARMLNTEPAALHALLARGRDTLLAARERRVRPGRDDKRITAWNAMMIEAMAAAGAVLDMPRFTQAAARAADAVWQRHRLPDGRLCRTYKDGAPRLNAYLEDYAYLANALVTLYEADFQPRWIAAALECIETLRRDFWDEADGGFFHVGGHHEPLIVRGKDPHDNATPSGNAMAVTALVRLAKLTGRGELAALADQTFRLFRATMEKSATATAQMLLALGMHLGPTAEFAVVGDPADPEVVAALRRLRNAPLSNKVVACAAAGDDVASATVPLLANKPALPGQPPTVYICENFTCATPLAGLPAFAAALAERVGDGPTPRECEPDR